jgi:hypothetical protein
MTERKCLTLEIKLYCVAEIQGNSVNWESINGKKFNTEMKSSLFRDIKLCILLNIIQYFGGMFVDFWRTVLCYMPEDRFPP